MSRLEVGMYYRYKEMIGKYHKPDLEPAYFTNQNKYGWHEIANGGKFSHNIIDLIEVGDYVNGFPVIHKENDILKCGLLVQFKENEIKSIVTKEQFEQMAYKVGE